MTECTNSFRRRRVPKLAGFIGTAAITLGSFGGVAWAGGNSAQSMTFHVHGDATGIAELDFNPSDAPPAVSLPANCWVTPDEGFISTTGNAIMHETINKTGDWFTTTYTGGAALYPLVEVDGVPVVDPDTENNEVDSSGTALATGHLTLWFGQEDNNQNGVQHATVSFHGTDLNGNPVSIDGHFQFAMNANGQPTAVVGSVSC